MDYLELKDPGASVALLVQKVERRKSKFGEDYALIGNVEPNRQASVSVPEKAMERQMAKILKIDDADDLKGRFVVVSRSDEPGANGKLYWNVNWADESTYSPSSESKRVPPPQEDFAASLRNDPNGRADGATQPRAKENPRSESQARPAASEPVTKEELTDLEKKQRAGMLAVRTKFRALWKAEAIFQLQTAVEIANEFPDLPPLLVDGSSVNAATASFWITFDRRNYV